MKTKIPNEILHWSERAELSFYAGRLIERHFAPNDSVKKTHYQSNGAKFMRI